METSVEILCTDYRKLDINDRSKCVNGHVCYVPNPIIADPLIQIFCGECGVLIFESAYYEITKTRITGPDEKYWRSEKFRSYEALCLQEET